jgi:enoyl-CoA hydratase/carnithine racemase
MKCTCDCHKPAYYGVGDTGERDVKLILTEGSDGISVWRLNHGVTNALNLQLVEALSHKLQEVRESTAVDGVVLASANDKFFSIGLDVPELLKLTKEDFHTFYHAFNRVCMDLHSLPIPTVAAITGHAVAGGCILAICCDYVFVAAGKKLMGFNEIKLGLPVPHPADCILRLRVDHRSAREIVETGEFYQPEQALQLGLADRVLPLELVVHEAILKARRLAALPSNAYSLVKRQRVAIVERQVAKREAEERVFLERWHSPETQARLSEAAKRF